MTEIIGEMTREYGALEAARGGNVKNKCGKQDAMSRG